MIQLKLLILAIAVITGYSLLAQVAITTNGTNPDGSAMLDVQSTDKGFLPPRLTLAQIQAIESPANALMVYNTDDAKSYIFIQADNQWKEIKYGAGTIAPTFVCGQSLFDARDSKRYSTVLIGTQCWMAENLNVGDMIHSTSGGTNSDGEQTDNSTLEKYCYDNNATNCDTYGGMYQWAEVVQYLNGASNTESWDPVPTGNIQGICPEGWHLPSDDEYSTLTTYVSNQSAWLCNSSTSNIAKALAATANWITSTGTCDVGNNLGANNATGFTALPGGSYQSGSCSNLGSSGNWWSCTEYSSTRGWMRHISNEGHNVTRYYNDKTNGISVRCLRD